MPVAETREGADDRSTNPGPRRITVTVEGGVIQDIEGIPPGVEVFVKDFDDDSENGLIETTWQAR